MEKNEYEIFCDNMAEYLSEKLRAQFPQVYGVGFGCAPFTAVRKILELPEEEQEKAFEKHLGFIILTETELSEEQKQEIFRIVGEKICKLETIGSTRPLC